jgi:tetratricopeptide (TPR) repeat protein
MQEEVYGCKSFASLSTLHKLGTIYSNLGHHSKAEAAYEVIISEVKKPSRDFTVPPLAFVSFYCDLAQACSDQNNDAKAEETYKELISLLEDSVGPVDADFLRALESLGSWYAKRGNLPMAIQIYQRLLQGQRSTFGAEHAETIDTLSILGKLYEEDLYAEDLDDYATRKDAYESLYSVQTASLGPEHPDTLITYHCLGVIHRHIGDYHKAEEVFRKVVAIRTEVLGSHHVNTLDSLSELAVVHKTQENWPKAEEIYQTVCTREEEVSGPDHCENMGTLFELSEVYLKLGKLEEAERTCSTVIKVRRGCDKEEDWIMFGALEHLAAIYTEGGNRTKAEETTRAADALREKLRLEEKDVEVTAGSGYNTSISDGESTHIDVS